MAKKPLPAPVVDVRRELGILRATEAPVIFFEAANSHGVRNGVGNITLEGGIHLSVDGQVVNDVRVAAHLRFPVSAIPSLRAALDGIENALKPIPDKLKN